jgi:N-acetylglucosamine-6-phosphate deacetylase
MVTLADVPLKEAVSMMTATPARMIGLENSKGSIAPGMDADLVLFDELIQVRQVMVGGRMLVSDLASR